ncbi:hypothetical protein Aduo_010221 [Ancylostoma duodenale]
MLSWWFGVGVLAVAAPTYSIFSAFAVRQTEFDRECVELLCPETSFDNGVKSLVDEDSLSTEQCVDCQQCTANGYSVCMGVRPTRASRVEGNNPCSCSHSVPANCHNRLYEKQHPANLTMKQYSVCYLSALQAPPRPLAVSEKASVIFTIEPFWLEPYWRQLELENLTFHYDFAVKSPESCEGSVTSTEDGIHLCNNAISLNMTIPGGEDDEKDEEYEHSENYDQYDDDLPEEVEIDREIFGDAKEVQVYYIVDVNRPRQLQAKSPSGELIHDVKTSVESEILKFDLNSDGEIPAILPTPSDTLEEDADVSEEQGGTEFFDEEKQREDKQEEKGDEKGDDDDDDKDDDKQKPKAAETKSDDKDDDNDDEEKKDDHGDDEKDDDDEEEIVKGVISDDDDDDNDNGDDKDGTDDKDNDDDQDDNKEKDHDDEKDDDKDEDDDKGEKKQDNGDDGDDDDGEDNDNDDDNDNDNDNDDDGKDDDGDDDDDDGSDHPAMIKHRDQGAAHDDDVEHDKDDDKDDDKADDDDDNDDDTAEKDDHDDDDGEEDEDDEDLTFVQRIIKDKGMLARWVFGITIVVCLVFIIGICAFRKRCCCQKERKTSNGNKYSSVHGGQPRSVPPEKERLNQ